MLRLEFHCHTSASPDSLTPPESLIAACRKKGIDRVVVTDHNTIAGARAAYALAPEMVIVGEEIMTTQGELLAAYVHEEVPRGLSPMGTIERLRAQGAFISVAHPFDEFRRGGWALEDLEAIRPHVDAIETFNSRCLRPEFNHNAREYADKHNLTATVGSDAHGNIELGRSTILLDDFSDAASLKKALATARCETRLSPPWIMMISRWAKIVKSFK